MENPFVELAVKPDITETSEEIQQKMAKREAIYSQFDPLVNDVLNLFISAHRRGDWQVDSDCTRTYCCHISWFAGPREKYRDPYDQHHTTRRRIEVALEMDGLCNPTGFKVTNYDAIDKVSRVGLSREELVRGIQAVMG